jgi:hypothetical protein
MIAQTPMPPEYANMDVRVSEQYIIYIVKSTIT